MNQKNTKSFNSQVYSIACNRLKLKRREKIIFYRLLGFLIRNDKPFPYSSEKLAELTGYSRSSVFECLNLLEKMRLIDRIGFTSRARFIKGIILLKICSLVQNRIKREQNKKYTLVQKLDKESVASPETGYNKTSLSLKHNNMADFLNSLTPEERQERAWYENNPRFPVKEEDRYLFPEFEIS